MPFDPSGTEHVGAVGHYISALLQTAGLYGQAAVLEFMGTIIGQIGMLVYIVACISALLSVAIFGGYRQAAYLLIGPALFFFVLNTRVPASGTEVRMGAQTQSGSVENVRTLLDEIGPGIWPIGDHPEVSWFFVLYDDMITQIIHNCAALLLDDNRREDLIAVGRERVYSQINMFKSENAGFVRLLVLGMTKHCGEAQALGRELKSQVWDSWDPSYTERLDRRAELLSLPTVEVKREVTVKEYLINILPSTDGNGNPITANPTAVPPVVVVEEDDFEENVSCQQIWDWTVAAARKEAEQLEAKIVQTNRTDFATDPGGNPNIDRDHNNVVIPWDEVWDDVELLAAGGDSNDMVTILMAILIKNTLKHTQHGAIISTMTERSDFNQARFSGKFMFMAKAEAKAFYHQIMYFAGAIPYVQGLLLYLLCMVFPFFAIFLLIPGRLSSFAVWMSLWLWVKSWDVGFAFVYSVRGVLQYYMIGDLEESLINGEGNPINFSDPAAIEEFVTSSDPIATEGTYMMIVALLSCSVPVLTAHLCMGASHLTGLLDLSVKEASTRHYGDARNKAIREEATKLNQEIKAMRLAFVNHATNEAAQNPGQSVGVYKDSQGRMQREMVDRRKAGDWAVAGHLGGEAQKANYKFMFTKQFMESHALLGSLTGRRMTFNMSRMDKAQVSISNQIQDMFHSHALGLGGGLGSPFAARQKGTSTVADGVKNANMGTDGN